MPFANGFPTQIEQSINKIIASEEYSTYDIENNQFSTGGGNYLSLLYEVDIKGKVKSSGEDKETNIFVKSITTETSTPWMSIKNLYRIELIAYEKLSEIFADLQKEVNIPVQERYKMVKSYPHNESEVLILENLSKKGFSTYHRIEIVSLEFAEKSMQELAKLHALSFALQQKRPEYFKNNIKQLKHPFNVNSSGWKGFNKAMIDIAIKFMNEDMKDKFEKLCYQAAENYGKALQDDAMKFCLCHGDYRPNNIMTKIDNGKVEEIIPIDYQLMHYGCPVYDILYYLCMCTDRQFRKAHLSHLLDHYHDAMTTFLEHFDIDVNTVYPREKFDELWKEKQDYFLLVGYLFLPFMLVSDDDVPDLSKMKEGSNFQVQNMFEERLRGVIDDIVDYGYL